MFHVYCTLLRINKDFLHQACGDCLSFLDIIWWHAFFHILAFLHLKKFLLFCCLLLLALTKIIIFVKDAGRHAHSRSTLEVPIFWFIYSEPLLLDKHFQAKALSDMVIVVQSEPSSWESHLHCNGRSLLLNLRLDSEIYFSVFKMSYSSSGQSNNYWIRSWGNILTMEIKDSRC